MKNIVIVSSTPRKNGNSELLAAEFKKGAEEKGHKVTDIFVRELDMKFCKIKDSAADSRFFHKEMRSASC